MSKTRLDVAHIIASALLLKANAEIIKCTDNGFNTTVRLRTDDKLIDVKVEVYDLEKENDRTPGGTDETVERIVCDEYNTI
ncbi:MAG: hypothetical protein U0L88_07595 [Acutalibacteraceae bacterium]|nr:hypothetical protein [Acutalibacteraceae bacterium]